MLVQANRVQREIFLFATARVRVDLQLDQLGHGVHPIAHHTGGFAFVGRCDVVADHQQTVLFTANKTLDDDLAALGQRNVISGFNVFLARQLQRHSARMVAVGGLDANGQADVLGRFPRCCRAVDNLPLGDGHTAGAEQLLGQVFVFGDAFGNGAGAVGLSRPDAALLVTVAQLYQVAVVQTNRGNAPFAGCIHDAGRAGPDAQAVDHLLESVDFALDIKSAVFDGRQNQRAGGFKGASADGFMARANDHFVDAAGTGFAGFAKTRLHAGLGLQLQRHVLQHMACPSAFF